MIIAIVGPTGSGKSHLAEFLRKKINGIVVNFDAFQVYKNMDIGTAKPSKKEIEENGYVFYDFVSVSEDFDVSKYQKICRDFLDNNKDKNIILVGGTGLYLKSVLYDYKFEKESPMPENYLDDIDNLELYKRLEKIDKQDALKIGKNNRKRLLRALYIFETHKKSKTELNNNGKNKKIYDFEIYGLDIDRNKLYEKINSRVDTMFENGLEKEVENLFSLYGTSLRALQAIGYKEFNTNLNIDEKKELIKKNTRNYAKRQMTFFKHQFENITWFNSLDEAYKYVERKYK